MTTPPANQVARLEYVVREQMAEIDRLRAEVSTLVDWVMGDRDALTALQAIYNNATTSETNRVKAAAAAIGYERPKPAASLVVVDFRERVRQARLKADAKLIEHMPEPALPEPA
jgi:hypothetical protein